jgi:hypothetical protein
MGPVPAFIAGVVIGAGLLLIWLGVSNKEDAQAVRRHIRNKLPPGVRRGRRPDVRRIVLRPVNVDQPPSRITQALFRQRPTRKLREDDARDID